jgi:hypothetical protein
MCYPFDVMHPLFATHMQMVRSKLFIPLLCGGKPPTTFSHAQNKQETATLDRRKAQAR